MNELMNLIGTDLVPALIASLAEDEETQVTILKIGKACKKHDIPFLKFLDILSEVYQKHENN